MTTNDTRRITLIARGASTPDRDWERSRDTSTRVVVIESLTVLRYTLTHAVSDIDLDIERVVLDRSFSAAEYLDIISQLPHGLACDVLLIRDDETGYLSAAGRTGDRQVYGLSPHDVRFYLETNELVTARIAFRERLIA